MGFLIDGKSMNSPECRGLMAKCQDDMVRQPLVDATLAFDAEQAFLDFEDASHMCRPYLVLLGRPVSVSGEFPFDIIQMRYQDPADKGLIAYRYELTRHNITELAAKGLYDEGFEVPSIVRENQFELPCKVNCAALPSQSGLPPVMFASLEIGSLTCSDETSGYRISEYFESVPEPDTVLEQATPVADSVYQRTLEDASKEYGTVVSDTPVHDAVETPVVEETPKLETKPKAKSAPKQAPVLQQPGSHRDVTGIPTPSAPDSDYDDTYLI